CRSTRPPTASAAAGGHACGVVHRDPQTDASRGSAASVARVLAARDARALTEIPHHLTHPERDHAMRPPPDSNAGDALEQVAIAAADIDAPQFNGSDDADAIAISAQHGAVVAQTAGAGKVSFNGVTELQVNPLGGPDQITVHDLSGSGLQDPSINLAATSDGTTP